MLQLIQSENILKNKDKAYRVAYIPYPKGIGVLRSVYKFWFKAVTKLAGCDPNRDIMLPVCGTYQGGFTPHFIK
jgi:hypothetical protein